MGRRAAPRMGLIVNPVAGVGGRLALKGSDDVEAVGHALAAGAAPVSGPRALRALALVARAVPDVEVLAPAGEMGGDLAVRAGIATNPLAHHPLYPSTAADTAAAAAELAAKDVDLLLFAGGDGTARDIADAISARVPMLGVPSGVKMRSGVFGTSPEAAGEAAGRYLASPGRYPLREAEVVDAAGEPEGLASTLHGTAPVPAVAGALQGAKSSTPRSDEAALAALCANIAAQMEPGRLYLLGPGTTTARIARCLGVESTPLGVDAVRDGSLVARDLDEHGILRLLADEATATIVLGVIGRQGFLLGRGNQQLSPEVVRRVGADNLIVVAGADKVLALDPPGLRVDLGDLESDPVLDGYLRVHVAPERSIMLRILR